MFYFSAQPYTKTLQFEELISNSKLKGLETKILDFGKQRGTILFKERERRMQIHASKILKEKTNNKGNFQQFSIGKASIGIKRKRCRGVNTKTWDTKNLINRYKELRFMQYDGLIVIGFFTKLDKPAGRRQTASSSKKKIFQNEHLTIRLKQGIISYFNFDKCDPRIINDSFATGSTAHESAPASCLYLVYKIHRPSDYKEFESETDDDNEEEMEEVEESDGYDEDE